MRIPKKRVDVRKALMSDAEYQEWSRTSLTDLLVALRDAKEVSGFERVRDMLLDQLVFGEQAVLDGRKAGHILRARRSALAKESPRNVDALGHLNAQIDRLKHRDEIAVDRLQALRTVGDALAWRALGCDRRVIAILSDGTRVDRLATGIGLAAERAELARHGGEALAIHNDSTRCLRHGDVTLVKQPGPQGRFMNVIEVKAGDGDRARQDARIADALRLLQSGSRVQPSGTSLTIEYVPGTYSTFLPELPALVDAAKRDGYAKRQLSPVLAVEVWDYRLVARTPADAERHVVAGRAALLSEAGWEKDDTISWMVLQERMNRSSFNVPRIAPISLYPLAPSDLADLLCGWLEVRTTVHRPTLAEQLGTAGLEVEVHGADDDPAITITVGDVRTVVPMTFMNQILVELPTDATIAMAVRTIGERAARRRGTAEYLVVFEDERSAWTKLGSGSFTIPP